MVTAVSPCGVRIYRLFVPGVLVPGWSEASVGNDDGGLASIDGGCGGVEALAECRTGIVDGVGWWVEVPGVFADAVDPVRARWEGVVDEGGEDVGGGVGSESLLGLVEALGVEWTEVVGGAFDDGGGATMTRWADEPGVGPPCRSVDVTLFEGGPAAAAGPTGSGVGVRGRFD
jgi:hypothetical protein